MSSLRYQRMHQSTSNDASNDIMLFDQVAFGKAAQAQLFDVQAVRLPVQDQLTHQQTGGRPVHETVAAETGHDVQTARLSQPVDNRVSIGSDLVKARPLAQQA